jgi:hypothetical protein
MQAGKMSLHKIEGEKMAQYLEALVYNPDDLHSTPEPAWWHTPERSLTFTLLGA